MYTTLSSILPVLPVCNEETRLLEVLTYYRPYFTNILVVDNHSTDNTSSICSKFNNISYVLHRNSGTTECPQWRDWLVSCFPSSYYLFLSCSERLSHAFLERLPYYIDEQTDIVYINRFNKTGSFDTSFIFSDLITAAGFRSYTHKVCRFVSYRAYSSIPIIIHDNFGSSSHMYDTHVDLSDAHAITYIREINPEKIFLKHMNYAKMESVHIRKPLQHLIYWITREIIFLLIAIARFKLNQVIINELLIRVIMHIQIYIYATSALYLPCMHPPDAADLSK